MWAPTFRILRNILRWLPSSGYQLLGSFLHGARTTMHPHPHNIYIFFFKWQNHSVCFLHRIRIIFLNLAKLHLLKLAGQLSIATWGKFSAREPGKVQDIEDAFRLSDLPFHYHRLSLALPIFVYAVLAEKKPHWLVLYMNVGFHLISLFCIGSELWNGRTIAICGVFSRIRGICIHLSRCRLGKGKFWNSESIFFQKLRGFVLSLEIFS